MAILKSYTTEELIQKQYNLEVHTARTEQELSELEKHFRVSNFYERIPLAVNTSFVDIATIGIPDAIEGWNSDYVYYISQHSTRLGIKELCRQAEHWYTQQNAILDAPIDIISISAGIYNEKISLRVLIRAHGDTPNLADFFESLGENIAVVQPDNKPTQGNLVIPSSVHPLQATQAELQEHKTKYQAQNRILEASSKEKPFLNQIEEYIPKKIPDPLDTAELVYDLKTKNNSLDIRTNLEDFWTVFAAVMDFVSGIEYYNYTTVIEGREDPEQFLQYIETYVEEQHIKKGHLEAEDLPVMMNRIYNALFEMYVLQDLIDDPQISDIKVTAFNEIRVRVKGKAYISNVHFTNTEDYLRFINALCIKNDINPLIPEQTFTEERDDNYILRVSLYAEYVNSVGWPYLHIRKVSRKKMLGDDLIQAGMFTPKVRDYLLDCGKNSRGIVFAGPPGSGKTVALNWFLEEAYEQSAEILVIQENDELFSNRKGVMFQHVVHYAYGDRQDVSLEDLGQLALVAGANVFIIGEAKGPEICSAITLSNSGCRTAITIHSPSSTETIDKMEDLAMRGYAQDYNQAKRMLKSFQTIVYLQDFAVQEIAEIVGYDENTHDMIYRYIYRKEQED